jgi:hypothetical protein
MTPNFSVERMAAGGTRLQIWALVSRRHRSPRRWAAEFDTIRAVAENVGGVLSRSGFAVGPALDRRVSPRRRAV